MSLASTSPPITAQAARADSIGYLPLTFVGKRLPLQVLRSAAGYYIGAFDDHDGPCSRESFEYFPSRDAAAKALATGAWTQRSHP